jgi:GT2 family glycosyltransferase
VPDSPFDEELDLLIVFTCFRSAGLTIDCLRSLESEIRALPRVKVMICENGTGPESVEQLTAAIVSEGWESWIVLRAVHPNRGFSGGNNVILREALAWPSPPKNFLLLNTDTLVRPHALRGLLEAAEQHPEAGVIGPRLEWPSGEPQISCFRYWSPVSQFIAGAGTVPLTKLLSRWNPKMPVSEKPIVGEWVTFACALIRREVIDRLGLLDEGYYLYFDDVDYCRRVRNAGWTVLYWPSARVVHLRGQSNPVKRLTRERRRRPYYYYASRARYFAKFYGRSGLWCANVLWGLGRCISLLREWFGSKTPHTCENEWRDLWINAIDPMRAPEEASMQGREDARSPG